MMTLAEIQYILENDKGRIVCGDDPETMLKAGKILMSLGYRPVSGGVLSSLLDGGYSTCGAHSIMIDLGKYICCNSYTSGVEIFLEELEAAMSGEEDDDFELHDDDMKLLFGGGTLDG